MRRLTDEQMHMLWHHDVTNNVHPVPAANPLQIFFKDLSGTHGIQQLHPPETAEGDEVQTPLVLITDWLGHLRRFYSHTVVHPTLSFATANDKGGATATRGCSAAHEHAAVDVKDVAGDVGRGV